jgi:hypothetical protein
MCVLGEEKSGWTCLSVYQKDRISRLFVSREYLAEDRVIIAIGEKQQLIKRSAWHGMGDKLAIVLPTYS